MTEKRIVNAIPLPTEKILSDTEKRQKAKRLFYDTVFALGCISCLPIGAFPEWSSLFSLALTGCILLSFFDDNFYLYTAIFMFLRYKMLLGDTPVFRIYSYLMVIKLLLDLKNIKFRVVHLPAVVVFTFHCVFALGNVAGMRLGFNALVDLAIIWLVLAVVLQKDELFRRFIFAFLIGGVLSGVYGWTNAEVTVDINIRGAGKETVSRNFGALGDANFAGLYYVTCFYAAIFLKTIKPWLKIVFAGLFLVMLLQTASLSALITLAAIGGVAIILKYKMKSILILTVVFTACVIIIGVLLSIPEFREISAISGLLIRISEKLSYISMGRWDLLTTDRYTIWQNALRIFSDKSMLGQLLGGSVITVMYTDPSLVSFACHQSILQALLNFGTLGTMCIYLPLLGVIAYRLLQHFVQKIGYEKEDINIIRIIFPVCFLVFGMTVDFYTDWAYLFFYFI